MLDQHLVEACIRLRNIPELTAFTSWLRTLQQTEMVLLTTMNDEAQFRRTQGRTQMLTEIIQMIEDSPQYLEKMRNR